MIKRVYSKRLNKHVWSINITVGGRRYRQSGFASADEAKDAIASLRLQARADKFNLPGRARQVTLGELLALARAILSGRRLTIEGDSPRSSNSS